MRVGRRAYVAAQLEAGADPFARLRRGRHPASKPVQAPDGRTWPSTDVAAEELRLTRQAIASSCRQKALAGGQERPGRAIGLGRHPDSESGLERVLEHWACRSPPGAIRQSTGP
jgi:hypothetical protein